MRIAVAHQAVSDRDEILDFYGDESSKGKQFTRDLGDSIALLERLPGLTVQRTDLTRYRVRFWLIHPFFLLLKPDTKVLTVVCHPLLFAQHCPRELRQRLRKSTL